MNTLLSIICDKCCTLIFLVPCQADAYRHLHVETPLDSRAFLQVSSPVLFTHKTPPFAPLPQLYACLPKRCCERRRPTIGRRPRLRKRVRVSGKPRPDGRERGLIVRQPGFWFTGALRVYLATISDSPDEQQHASGFARRRYNSFTPDTDISRFRPS